MQRCEAFDFVQWRKSYQGSLCIKTWNAQSLHEHCVWREILNNHNCFGPIRICCQFCGPIILLMYIIHNKEFKVKLLWASLYSNSWKPSPLACRDLFRLFRIWFFYTIMLLLGHGALCPLKYAAEKSHTTYSMKCTESMSGAARPTSDAWTYKMVVIELPWPFT